MQKFNLEKFSSGNIATDRNGRVYRFIAYVPEASGTAYQLIVLSLSDMGIMAYKPDGHFLSSRESGFDLISISCISSI